MTCVCFRLAEIPDVDERAGNAVEPWTEATDIVGESVGTQAEDTSIGRMHVSSGQRERSHCTSSARQGSQCC